MFEKTFPSRSLLGRLLAPIAVMLALLLIVQLLDGQVRRRVIAADAIVTQAQVHALQLAELRSISRSLQRDALNLVSEPDAAALADIRARFDKRHAEFAQRLAAIAETREAAALGDYLPTQHRVLAALGRTRAAARRARGEALATFRSDVRPAERHASAIADAAIDRSLATIARAQADATALQKAEARDMVVLTLILTALAVALAAWLIVATVLRPLAGIRHAMDRLAGGLADGNVPHTGRLDEIGAMARSIEVFSTATRERDRLRVERDEERRHALERDRTAAGQRTLEEQRRSLLTELAGAVDRSLGTVNAKLRQSAERLSRSADAVTLQAGSAAAEAEHTADAARGATADLLAVTSASAQLVTTVERLRAQTGAAADAIGRAAGRSRAAAASVTTLAAQADRVAGMAETIRSVAHRSRLLALNATIEAARVGEAGRGFVVVAGEIKKLALQTADATHEVEGQAGSIRGAADEAVAALVEIDALIAQIAEDAAAVGSAMNQQGAAGYEIGAGMTTALSQVEQVADRMHDLRATAAATGAVAGALQADASALAADANSVDEALRVLVGDLRAAG